MTDTEMTLGTRHPRLHRGCRRSFVVRHCGPRPLIAASLAWLTWLAGTAAAQPVPRDARVAWVRGPYAYIASHDSLALAPFSLLTFTSKGKPIATGELERLVDGGMAIARITSGSLGGVKDLDRVRILAEPPRGPRLLRLGYPSGRRTPLLIGCEIVTIQPALTLAAYREDTSHRLIRNGEDLAHARWPDTLLVRAFDDVADQEIAVERGELDVALFWPGELSAHMREHPRWKDRLSWPLERGLIGMLPESGSPESRCMTALRMAAAFRDLGQNLLRGDLDVSRDGVASCSDTLPSSPFAVRYEVDPSCQGRATLERFLNRDATRAPGAAVRVVRVSCHDARTFSSYDVVTAAAQCQVVCASRLVPYFRELGPTAFFMFVDCVPHERRP